MVQNQDKIRNIKHESDEQILQKQLNIQNISKMQHNMNNQREYDWSNICGKIVNLDNSSSALMYISVKQKGNTVWIEQEIANHDDKNPDHNQREQNMNFIQHKQFLHEFTAIEYAKDVFQRFINDGCFVLTDV